jgi:CheY-like chemotaxis protein
VRTLIADHEATRAKGIAEACIARGVVVESASHGAAALEVALERVPDIVICPIALPVIDGLRLSEILRGNPRTRGASFLFLVTDELDMPILMDPRDATVASPWPVDDVLHYVDAALERSARFPSTRSDSEISGKLTQISLLDLLQIFQMNGKTGRLRVSDGGGRSTGVVLVRRGQVIDATIPLSDGTSIAGEKALFRLLTWREGRFDFVPGEGSGAVRIQTPMRSLLLEGLRQKDELEKSRADLPADVLRLRLVASTEEVRSLAQAGLREVAEAVKTYLRVGEIVDHCSMPDYQVLCALADLLGRDILAVEKPCRLRQGDSAEEDGNIFTEVDLRRLREWASAVHPRSGSVVKVPVLCGEQGPLERLRDALAESSDFLPDPRMAREPRRAGSLGQFSLGNGASLRLIAVPADPSYAPLWEVAGDGMLGAIVLAGQGTDAGTEAPKAASAGLAGFGPILCLAEGSASADEDAVSHDTSEGIPTFFLPRQKGPLRLEGLRSLFARLVP